jgi:hypothetical protein
MKTGGMSDSDSDTDTDASEMPGLLSVFDTLEGSLAGGGGERVSAAGGGGGTDDGQQGGSPAAPTGSEDEEEEEEEDPTRHVLCGTVGRDCGLNVGGTHVGPICLKSMWWEGPWHAPRSRESVTVVVCAGTGQVLNSPEMAEAYNLDGQKQVQVSALQREQPWVIPGYTYSSDSDAEENGQDRVQPETAAILANLQPRCPRYFYSSCRDCLFDLCPNFKLRYMFSVWQDHCEEAYADRMWHKTKERSWIREAREEREAAAGKAAARDQVAALQAFQSQAAILATDQLPVVQAFLAAPGGT